MTPPSAYGRMRSLPGANWRPEPEGSVGPVGIVVIDVGPENRFEVPADRARA
jgi:hypothetical protein